jgi:hypothetical protein
MRVEHEYTYTRGGALAYLAALDVIGRRSSAGASTRRALCPSIGS